MLAPAARLRSRAEFTEVVRAGDRAGSSALVVYLDRSAGAAGPRVGFVVGRAVGPAVVRNRVRRRLRHLVRARLDRLPPDSRLVVRANPAAATCSSVQLAVQLDRLLARVPPVAPVTAGHA